jgi:hypothetical protein
MNFLVRIREKSLSYRMVALGLFNLVVGVPAILVGYLIGGIELLKLAVLADLVCWLSFSLALGGIEPFRRRGRLWAGFLVAMAFQVSGPMGLIIVARFWDPPLDLFSLGCYVGLIFECLLAFEVLLILPPQQTTEN